MERIKVATAAYGSEFIVWYTVVLTTTALLTYAYLSLFSVYGLTYGSSRQSITTVASESL